MSMQLRLQARWAKRGCVLALGKDGRLWYHAACGMWRMVEEGVPLEEARALAELAGFAQVAGRRRIRGTLRISGEAKPRRRDTLKGDELGPRTSGMTAEQLAERDVRIRAHQERVGRELERRGDLEPGWWEKSDTPDLGRRERRVSA